jgi:hypothetical protein
MRLQKQWTRWTLNATAQCLRRKRNPPTTSNPPGAERGRRKEGWTQTPIQTFSFFCALSSSSSLFCKISMIFEICAHVCASMCVCKIVTISKTHPHPYSHAPSSKSMPTHTPISRPRPHLHEQPLTHSSTPSHIQTTKNQNTSQDLLGSPLQTRLLGIQNDFQSCVQACAWVRDGYSNWDVP